MGGKDVLGVEEPRERPPRPAGERHAAREQLRAQVLPEARRTHLLLVEAAGPGRVGGGSSIDPANFWTIFLARTPDPIQ